MGVDEKTRRRQLIDRLNKELDDHSKTWGAEWSPRGVTIRFGGDVRVVDEPAETAGAGEAAADGEESAEPAEGTASAEDLTSHTVAELRAIASQEGVDLAGAGTKAAIIEAIQGARSTVAGGDG